MTIHLVDQRNHGRFAQTANFEQLDRSILDPFRRIDDHECGINRRQRSVSILREVLVAGRIEQVDDAATVFELHHRGGYRDAALLFDLHPVGCCMALTLARFHRAGSIDRPAEQQQFFRNRCFAGIRMRNNRERAPTVDFPGVTHTPVPPHSSTMAYSVSSAMLTKLALIPSLAASAATLCENTSEGLPAGLC